jgi:outer membrane lipoprotein-sorting protein
MGNFFKQSTTILIFSILTGVSHGADSQARDIVKQALDHWRGVSSVGEMKMTIHRPEWERSMSMRIWTQGSDKSLVRITAPKKDLGNGTLVLDNNMWSYSPKVKRVIRIPSSMMGQGWMGSDFSNKDVSRSDDIVDQYTHTLIGTRRNDGRDVYIVESVPHEDAAIVWGRELLEIRADWVILKHSFYDQDDELVQELEALEIGEMGGRTAVLRQRMGRVDARDEWTELQVINIEYNVDISDRVFTLANLKNPRE